MEDLVSKKRKIDSSEWCDIPQDILDKIVEDSRWSDDHVRLVRSVCMSWRSMILPKKSPPNPIKLPTPHCKWPKFHGYSVIVESPIYHIQSPDTCFFKAEGWLVKVEEDAAFKKMKEPLSRWRRDESDNDSDEEVDLPLPTSSVPKILDLCNFRVSCVGKSYRLQYHPADEDGPEATFYGSPMLDKVVLSRDYAALMVLHNGGGLGLFKFGGGDQNWINIDYDNAGVDIAYHNGQFYAINYSGKVLVIDFNSFKLRHIEPPLSVAFALLDSNHHLHKHLVESFGDLFMVDRYVQPVERYDPEDDEYLCEEETFYFQVYKLNDEGNGWVQVKCLGDKAFFLGDECTFSVLASDLAGCKQNCIYFTESYIFRVCGDHDLPAHKYEPRVFNLEDATVRPLSSFPDTYSRIFCPPPTWFSPYQSSSSYSPYDVKYHKFI